MEQDLNNNVNQTREFNWNKVKRVGFFWLAILVAAILFTNLWNENDTIIIEISFIEYQKILDNDNLKSGKVIVKENILLGETKDPISIPGNEQSGTFRFKTILPFIDDQMVKDWRRKNIDIQFITSSHEWTDLLFNFIPWIIIVVAWIFLVRNMKKNKTEEY